MPTAAHNATATTDAAQKKPPWQQMHPFTSALLQHQAPPTTGAQASAEEEAVPKMAPGHKERQQLHGRGVKLPSTLQGDDNGFELVMRWRSTQMLPKAAIGGRHRVATLPMENPPSYDRDCKQCCFRCVGVYARVISPGKDARAQADEEGAPVATIFWKMANNLCHDDGAV